MNNLARIDANRTAYRQKLSTECATIDQQIDTFTKRQLLQAKVVINNYISKLNELDATYLDLLKTDNDDQNRIYNEEVNLCISLSDTGHMAIGAIDTKLQELNDLAATTNNATSLTLGSNGNTSNGNRKSRVKIPPVTLPKFSGLETEDYTKFIYNLEQVFDKREMKNYEKFLVLRDCLHGKAFDAISGLDIDANSWDLALQKLEKYFLNTDVNKCRLLDTFNDLKFNYSENVYKYFSRVDNIVHAIERSNIDINYVLQYFLWKSLCTNSTMENIFINITNNPYPDFNTLKDKRDIAMCLYEKQQKKFEKRRTDKDKYNKSNIKQSTKSNQIAESSLAANVPSAKSNSKSKNDSADKKGKTNVTWCILCKGTTKTNTHKIYRCPNYITSQQKIARLNEIKCCTKCSYSTHTADKCKFVFHNKCSHCSGDHYSWLCHVNENAKTAEISDEGIDESDNECDEFDNLSSYVSESEEEVVNMCSVVANNICLPSNAILPTFQGKVNGIACRGLKDSGCQMNFISERMVKEAKLKLGQKVELTVSGFNSSQTYKSYETKVPLEFANKIFNIDMIVLPNVTTKFAADGISSLAAGFQSKGYKLADPALLNDRNVVNNLDIVLGISATHVFMEKVRSYGKENENKFLETLGGIMPIGHSLNGYSGLPFLLEADKNKNVHSTARLSTFKNKTKPKLTTTNEQLGTKKVKVSSEPKSKQKSPKKLTQNSQINKKKVVSNISVATPATLEVTTISTTNSNKGTKKKTTKKKKNNSESGKVATLGSKFLQSLVPGYTKQEVFGDFIGFGATSELDLDKIMSQTLGYDEYEKQQPYSDLDGEIVDYIYNKT